MGWRLGLAVMGGCVGRVWDWVVRRPGWELQRMRKLMMVGCGWVFGELKTERLQEHVVRVRSGLRMMKGGAAGTERPRER